MRHQNIFRERIHSLFHLDNKKAYPLSVKSSQLMREIRKTGKPIMLILLRGCTYELTREKRSLIAILQIWYPREQEGYAVANILWEA